MDVAAAAAMRTRALFEQWRSGTPGSGPVATACATAMPVPNPVGVPRPAGDAQPTSAANPE